MKQKLTKADDMLKNEFFGRKKNQDMQFIENIQENRLSRVSRRVRKFLKKFPRILKKEKTLIRLGTIPLYKFNCCQNVKNHSVTIISSIYRFNHIFPFAHKILRILTKPIQFLLTLLLGIFHRSYIFTTSPVSFSIRQKWLARG